MQSPPPSCGKGGGGRKNAEEEEAEQQIRNREGEKEKNVGKQGLFVVEALFCRLFCGLNYAHTGAFARKHSIYYVSTRHR